MGYCHSLTSLDLYQTVPIIKYFSFIAFLSVYIEFVRYNLTYLSNIANTSVHMHAHIYTRTNAHLP